MLTDAGDLVVDPFAGSCVTGEVAERLNRNWLCVELVEDYLRGALGRFQRPPKKEPPMLFPIPVNRQIEYKLAHPAAMWTSPVDTALPVDGGRQRRIQIKRTKRNAAGDTA
jgi:site-specific DNA-methyltransferase (cytosine-N4-specific)